MIKIFAACMAALALGCAFGSEAQESVHDAIADRARAFEQCYAAKDAGCLASD